MTQSNLYVSSPVNALVQGILREEITLSHILKKGDFGLGTFNDLDGEMVLLDGIFYQLRSDGTALVASTNTQSPYACVTHFKPTHISEYSHSASFAKLQAYLHDLLLSQNLIYAMKITGRFSSLRARSVPKQEAYRPLVEVAHDQVEFNFEHVSGTLVGFWTPDFMHSVTVPGFHLHFLTDNRLHGGHLLDCQIEQGRIELQPIDQLVLDLPHSIQYLNASLDGDTMQALNKAEH
jgi:acetolactate decarboxylase